LNAGTIPDWMTYRPVDAPSTAFQYQLAGLSSVTGHLPYKRKDRYTSATTLNSTRSTSLKVNKVDRISNKVERIGNKVDRDKLSNSSCCRFVAKTGNKVERIRQQSTLLPICCRFRQQSTFNKIDGVQFNFVASVYRA